jgi:pilus assembly protein CpaC
MGGALSITIEYKEFGVRLRFRPTVLGDGTIRLHVAPEVSDLTESGAVIIQGFRVPALMTRRAETTLELKSGQTFSMAGLLNDRSEGRSSRVPGLGDVPVLGALFRSTRYVKGETEMVVLVTASLVEPLSIAEPPPLPGVLDVPPNDWEFYMEGLVEGRERPMLTASDAEWLDSIGFEGLRGPGAWESYETGEPSPTVTVTPVPEPRE